MLLGIKDMLPELYEIYGEIDEKSISEVVYKYCRSFCKTMKKSDCVVLDQKSNFEGVDYLNHPILFRSHRSGDDLIHKLRINKIKERRKNGEGESD